MPGEIKNLEIFSAGRHRSGDGSVITATETDLDTLVSAFTAFQGTNIVKPHLKLGHGDAQKWFGQDKGIPTLGWIAKVYRNGKKLLADVENVPDALIEMIRQKRYHNVSAEIFWDGLEVSGKKFARVLSAVALLGTEMPAVKDLAGLAQALFAQPFSSEVTTLPVTFSAEKERGMFTQDQVDSLIAAAVAKARKEFEDANKTALADLTKQVEVITARATGAETKIAKLEGDHATAEAVRIVDTAIKDGKLLPKQKDFALAFLTNAKGMVKFGDGEKTLAKLFEDFLGAGGKQVELGSKGKGDENSRGGNFATAAQEVDVKSKKLMSDNPGAKLTYAKAMELVFEAEPELKQRYATGE
jgi:hypothetical protein